MPNVSVFDESLSDTFYLVYTRRDEAATWCTSYSATRTSSLAHKEATAK